MVHARTYPLWQELAASAELPEAALPAVVEALSARTHARSAKHYGDHREEWREKALKEALPSLLERVVNPEVRAGLVAQASGEQVAELAAAGVVTAADLPAVLAAHRVQPQLVVGIAHHPHQAAAASRLLEHLHETDLDSLLTLWKPHFYQYPRYRSRPVPEVPEAFFDAVLERALAPLAEALDRPSEHSGWVPRSQHGDWSLEFSASCWRVVERCPERWMELTTHPRLGATVQHLLLEHAEPGALEEELLRACLPALCCPELAELPKPSLTCRERLRTIAGRVRRHPRLLELAAETVAVAVDACVRRGRLLGSARIAKQRDALSLAEDLAAASGNAQHLAKACALLSTLPAPAVVDAPREGRLARIMPEALPPHTLLQGRLEHQRAMALTKLAINIHAPRTAVTEALSVLTPVELAWIEHDEESAAWLREAAGALAPPEEEDDGVLRILTDDELDGHPDPAAVLQFWLDAPAADGVWTQHQIEHAVLNSRHHTLEHLRQLPVDAVLTHANSQIALPILLDRCGNHPERWAAMLPALSFDYSATPTFGEFLDALGQMQPAASTAS